MGRGFWHTYNEIVFLGNSKLGLLIFLFTLLYPNIAISGLLSLLTAAFLVKVLRVEHHYLIRGALFYNALLVGLYIGYLFQLDFLVLVLLFLSSCFTFLVTYTLNSFLCVQSLPVLSLPFTVVAILLALSAPGFSNLSDATVYMMPHHFSWMEVFPPTVVEGLRSLGAVFCIPDPFFGLLLMGSVVLFSPLTGIFLVLGYVIGVVGESTLIFTGYRESLSHHTFNYALLFTAIAGTFLLPSRRSLVWASLASVTAVLFTSACLTFWGGFRIPIMALPFNAMAFLTLRTLRSIGSTALSVTPLGSPERTLEQAGYLWLRHRMGESGVFCPLDVESTIQQGFYGEWTHQGSWAHALDFVIQGEDGKTYRNKGVELEDYLVFEQPVLSPVEGYVVALCSSLPDNPIGKVENQRNWGNYVIIKSLSGIYLSLAHLKKDSLAVKVGDYVTVGKQLALCGNSGYSQEPHLHLQLQLFPEPGSQTLPFHLLNYRIQNQGYFHRTPQKGERLAPFSFNAVLDRLLTFRIGQKLVWKLQDPRKGIKEITFEHRLDEASGIPYWTDGKSRLFYSRVGAQFYFYGLEGGSWSPLWDFFAAVPRIPVSFGQTIEFQDYLPLWLTHSTLARFLVLCQQLLFSKNSSPQARYVFDPIHLELRGTLPMLGRYGRPWLLRMKDTFCKIDPMTGFSEFRVGDRRYVRVA